MALKRRKDRRKREKIEAENAKKRERHWLDCKVCKVNGAEVDGTIEAFTCWYCTAMQCAPPEALRAQPAKGKLSKYKSAGFPHGWWLKPAFKGEHEGKTLYFSKGKEITKAEYKKLLT